MSAIGKAFKSIGKGIGQAFKSVGQIAKGVLTLDLKGAMNGVSGLLGAGLGIAAGIGNLHPAALAANTLMEGALNKLLCGPFVPKDLPAAPPMPQLPHLPHLPQPGPQSAGLSYGQLIIKG
jgi:hypothetical protein